MQAAVKLQVMIPRDRRVQLPDDLPEGEAEIIVLYRAGAEPAQTTPEAGRAPVGREPIDYFARLASRQPHPMSAEASRALDDANRGER